MRVSIPLCFVLACSSAAPEPAAPVSPEPAAPVLGKPNPDLRHPSEVHLADIVQLTAGGENAEAYWSFDGTQLIFQTTRPPFGCDQIMRMPADGSDEPKLVSTGKGRTTCSYFLPGDQELVYSSTHAASPECPPAPDHSQGYVWAIYKDYDIYRAKADGSNPVKLTDRDGYDAEATVCAKDGSIIFTSDRDGDLELYRMNADGSNVVRLTSTPGYDGGAFFSPDCTQIVWRASRPQGDALADYQRLLAQHLVRPSKLEIFVANADGSDARQITYLDSAAFAPYFHPSGKRILFSTNYGDPRGREFDIWAVGTDGSNLERITFTPGFDGFPMFSPDGTRLAFSSNRNQQKEGDTDVYVARWIDAPEAGQGAAAPQSAAESAVDRFMANVRWLADDAREGRGIGTAGLDAAADWLAARFQEIGATGAADASGGYKQSFEVVVELVRKPETQLVIDGKPVAAESFVPASFSASTAAAGNTVFAGYGIVAKDLGVDDYKGVQAKGKIVVVRRFTPTAKPFDDAANQRRYSDIEYKAFVARERGARALIVVDVPPTEPGNKPANKPVNKPSGQPAAQPAAQPAGQPGAQAAAQPAAQAAADEPLPALSPGSTGDVGIPVLVLTRAAGAALVKGKHQVSLRVSIEARKQPVHNIVAKIPAGSSQRLPGAVIVGAHYDHLGHGAAGSLEPGKHVIHNGADDNASGTAALLEVARALVDKRASLRRDVYLVAFTAEEGGVMGSRHFTQSPPPGLAMTDVVSMINMDMVGRMRDNQVSVMGSKSASEWDGLIEPACAEARLRCATGGDGYGPSDHMPFYTAGAPVLHIFSGAHLDYHKSSDDADRINGAGGAQIALLASLLTETVANRDARLTYQRAPMPERGGDMRAQGASLGTVPAYGDESGQPGVLLDDVRPGSPADKAGLRKGDRLVKIDSTEIRTLRDLMFMLRQAKPGQSATITVLRDGQSVEVQAVYGAPGTRGSR